MARVLITRTRDRGSALVMAAIVSVIVFALGAGMVALAAHQSNASNNDRRRQQAVDAALSGLVVADSALSRNAAYAGSGLQPFSGGAAEFEVTVVTDTTTGAAFRRIITATAYAPSKAASSKAVRTMQQVVELDAVGFTYGMFSETDLATGSSSTVIGDVYTNGNLTLGNSQDYIGNIFARGNISTGSNQKITGTVSADGDVSVSSSSTSVYGSVYAGGNILTGGTIRDTAQAGGSIGCAKVQGSCIPYSPPPRVPPQHLPTFVWDPANYPSVVAYASGAAFVAAVAKQNAQGTFYVTGNVVFSKQDTLYLTGDMTIVATGNIALPGGVSNHTVNGANVQLVIIATNAGTISPANNFTIPATVRTLMYTKGVFDAKNSSTFTGALYAGELSAGAHVSVTHALTFSPGFDWSAASPQSFTVRNVTTREISA